MPTIRELGMKIGTLETGARNHLTDVPGGLAIAHRTYRDAAKGICTGFTVIQTSPVLNGRRTASLYALNGAGELSGSQQILEWGYLDTPIVLTNTTSVGRAYDGLSQWMMKRCPRVGREDSVVIPIVGECDDTVMSDPRAVAWREKELFEALDESFEASRAGIPGDLKQGDVGGGSGMLCFDFKGGIGSSSRRVNVGGASHTVGVLRQTNFGVREQLTIDGRPFGRETKAPKPVLHKEGSCLGVLATDAPIDSNGLRRLAVRMGLGLARAGSHAHHGSGEIFVAFSTAKECKAHPEWESAEWNPLLVAAVEAAEEAVYNSLLCASEVKNSRAEASSLADFFSPNRA